MIAMLSETSGNSASGRMSLGGSTMLPAGVSSTYNAQGAQCNGVNSSPFAEQHGFQINAGKQNEPSKDTADLIDGNQDDHAAPPSP
jgi:hypothetical protein